MVGVVVALEHAVMPDDPVHLGRYIGLQDGSRQLAVVERRELVTDVVNEGRHDPVHVGPGQSRPRRGLQRMLESSDLVATQRAGKTLERLDHPVGEPSGVDTFVAIEQGVVGGGTVGHRGERHHAGGLHAVVGVPGDRRFGHAEMPARRRTARRYIVSGPSWSMYAPCRWRCPLDESNWVRPCKARWLSMNITSPGSSRNVT